MLEKHSLVMVSKCHIKHHTIGHKCSCSKYSLLHRRTSQNKHCKKPMDPQICILKE